MLTLNEYTEMHETISALDSIFTDSYIDRAESYSVNEDEATLQSVVELYDKDDKVVASIIVEDYDAAIVYMEEHFSK